MRSRTDRSLSLLTFVLFLFLTTTLEAEALQPATVTLAQMKAQHLYAVASGEQRVKVFDLSTNSLVGNITIGAGAQGIAISPDSRRAYTADSGSNQVSVIDTTSLERVATIAVAGGPVIPVVSPDSTRLYVSSFGSGRVAIIDTATNSPAGSFAISTPWGVAVSPNGAFVAATSYYSGHVEVFNTTTRESIGSLGGMSGPQGVVYHPNGSRIYVASLGTRSIFVVNASTLAKIAEIPLGGATGNGPVQLDFNANANRLYVADDNGGTAVEIDIAANKVLRTFRSGSGPRDVGVFGSTLYVSNNGANTVTAIDLASGRVTGTLNMQEPHSIAIASRTEASQSADCARFVADVTLPDGSEVAAGTTLEKRWRLRNCGARDWGEGYRAVRVGGDFGPAEFAVSGTANTAVELGTSITAPSLPGRYRATYRLRGPSVLFGDTFWVELVVTPITSTPPSRGTPSEPSPKPPQANDEQFVGVPAATAPLSAQVPIGRYFGSTLPKCAIIELMVRGPYNTPSASVQVNGRAAGAVYIDPFYSIQTLSPVCFSTKELKVPQGPGSMLFDAQGNYNGATRPELNYNSIALVDKPGLELAWVRITIKADLRPLVFVHGWTGGASTFARYDSLAYQQAIPHYPVEGMYLGRGVLSDEETISLLAGHVDRARTVLGVDKVNLVGHSRGGVISRLALGSGRIGGVSLLNQVTGLVSISSPHQGTRYIDLVAALQCNEKDTGISNFKDRCESVARDLTISSMRRINYGWNCRQRTEGSWETCERQFADQEAAAGSINFRSFTGTDGWTDVGHTTSTYPWLNSCERNPIPGPPRLDGTTLDTHLSSNSSDTIYERSLEVLRAGQQTQAPYSCPAPQGTATLAVDLNLKSQTILQSVGSVNANATRVHVIRVRSGEPLQILLIARTQVALQVKTPQGTILDPLALPNGTTYNEGKWFPEVFTKRYMIAAPEAGDWQAEVSGGSAASEEPYGIVVETNSSLSLQAQSESLSPQVGQPVTITAQLREGITVLSDNVFVAAQLPDGLLLRLRDTGAEGDASAGDGIFTTVLPGFDQSGTQQVAIIASLNGHERWAELTYSVVETLATVDAVTTLLPADPDDAGRWQALVAPVTITAPIEGVLSLEATLRTATGQFVARPRLIVQLEAGTQTVDFRISGEEIWRSRLEGPYTLEGLELHGQLGAALSLHQPSFNASSPLRLTWHDFAGESVVLHIDPAGKTLSGDGSLPPRIAFTGQLQVGQPGVYAWRADLFTARGERVAASRVGSQTLSGTASIQIEFDLPIASSSPRPYQLYNVTIWRVDDTFLYTGQRNQALASWGTSVFLPMASR